MVHVFEKSPACPNESLENGLLRWASSGNEEDTWIQEMRTKGGERMSNSLLRMGKVPLDDIHK